MPCTIRLEEIAAQRRQMRHQLISILLNGVVTPEMPRQMEMAQMYLPYSSYGLLMIPWTVENQGEGPWLGETLQALSGEGVALYGLWRRRLGEYAVLFNGPSEESPSETADILSDCLENHGLPGTVRRGRLCTELSQLPLSLIKQEDAVMIRVLCQNRQPAQADQESTQGQEITAYITQHVTEPPLSVNAVAGAFGIGARQVGQCVMKCAGMPYKEFVAR